MPGLSLPEAVLPPDANDLGLPNLDLGLPTPDTNLLSTLAASPFQVATWRLVADRHSHSIDRRPACFSFFFFSPSPGLRT